MSFVFEITNSAAKRILYMIENQPEKYLRISVEGGGCSGFMYQYSFTNTIDDDILITKNEATILIDKISSQFLNNASLDFVEELGSSYFQVINPNAIAKCGCGNSFVV